MESHDSSGGGGWRVYAVPLFKKDGRGYFLQSFDDVSAWRQWLVYIALLIAAVCAVLVSWLSLGGCAWADRQKRHDKGVFIPGPKGWPIIGSLMDMSVGLAHRKLESLSCVHGSKKIMEFSLGSTPIVITSNLEVTRDILSSPHFANRPLKESTQKLFFGRATGFAPNGVYWRLLRRIYSAHLFAPCIIAAHEAARMLIDIQNEYQSNRVVSLRPHLQGVALNNIMGSVFGRRFDMDSQSEEVKNLREMVDEGFQLLGAFN